MRSITKEQLWTLQGVTMDKRLYEDIVNTIENVGRITVLFDNNILYTNKAYGETRKYSMTKGQEGNIVIEVIG